MIDMRPVELTGKQWAALPAGDLNGLTIHGFSDVENVLVLAKKALGYLPDDDPLRCPALSQIHLWDTGNDDNDDLMITVDVPGLRLATELIEIRSFQAANDTPGEPVLRAVLTEILTYRNRILRELVTAVADLGGLIGYADHFGIMPEDLGEDVHDTASAQAAEVNNAGLEGQLIYLIHHYGLAKTRHLLDERAGNARA
ncbi:hypothetical protein ACWEU6_12910 [Streptosporangium sandarakinum]|uniref:hypothetical protein n=1 Tax=Streptosporangium sandarakinum TaxID=1260955 RepID=UPI0036B16539